MRTSLDAYLLGSSESYARWRPRPAALGWRFTNEGVLCVLLQEVERRGFLFVSIGIVDVGEDKPPLYRVECYNEEEATVRTKTERPRLETAIAEAVALWIVSRADSLRP